MTKKITDFIDDSALRGLKEQNKDGSMSGGHNGPYLDQDTPVRNTAHWILIWSSQKNKTNYSDFKCAINNALDYLIGLYHDRKKGCYICRTNLNKDSSNGLIGQAWLFEGLIAGSAETKRLEARELALNIFNQHRFDCSKGVWHKLSFDGNVTGVDNTFNHQLWFSAISSAFNDNNVDKKIGVFLDLAGKNVQVYPNGVIFHLSKLGKYSFKDFFSIRGIKNIIKVNLLFIKNKDIYYKSVGYHAFNLYAFALLKRKFPDHPFWSSKKMEKMLKITKNKKFIVDLSVSEFGWQYNPPGVELAFVGEVFEMGHEYCQKWLNLQLKHTYNKNNSELLTKNSHDINTSMARLYELTRLRGEYSANEK
jgi:hypothetical protein